MGVGDVSRSEWNGESQYANWLETLTDANCDGDLSLGCWNAYGDVIIAIIYVIHDSCRTIRYNSPCMKEGRCSEYFPKKFRSFTTIDEDGYPLHRRRDDGFCVDKNEHIN